MQELSGDPNVFIRSMASRGSLGGLAASTRDAVRALDAAGFDTILIETVGAGQAEVEIVRAAQTVVVVTVPGMGDDIQAIKAGILEIADIFVVNKADRPGADQTAAELRMLLSLDEHRRERIWRVPIITTNATTGDGVPELVISLPSTGPSYENRAARQPSGRTGAQRDAGAAASGAAREHRRYHRRGRMGSADRGGGRAQPRPLYDRRRTGEACRADPSGIEATTEI